MTDNGSNNSSVERAQEAVTAPVQKRRRTPLSFIILAVIFVVVPFLTWYLTWFGRPLSDASMESYLKDEKNVRHVQQALSQIEERIEKGDASVKRWYPQVIALAGSNVVEIRKTVAWVMGQDNKSEEFHAALQKLLTDAHPAVRRNAAVQLVRFQDASGRAELRATLQPFNVTSPAEGTITSVLSEGAEVRENALLARITNNQNQVQELRSPLHGKLSGIAVHEGEKVAAGDVVLSIAPDAEFVYEALRALFFIGEAEDLPDVERYSQGVEGMPEQVKQQAAQTARAIRSRSEQKSSPRASSSDGRVRKLNAVRGLPIIGWDHLDCIPGTAVEKRAVRTLADAFLAADAEVRVNFYPTERRMVFIRNPEHAGFYGAVFNAGGRACAARAAVRGDG